MLGDWTLGTWGLAGEPPVVPTTPTLPVIGSEGYGLSMTAAIPIAQFIEYLYETAVIPLPYIPSLIYDEGYGLHYNSGSQLKHLVVNLGSSLGVSLPPITLIRAEGYGLKLSSAKQLVDAIKVIEVYLEGV